jgi:hypothetical protein
VDGGGFDDHTAVLDELLDVCARVGVADLSLLSGIEPDFAFANAGDAGGETLLRTEVDWGIVSITMKDMEFMGKCYAHPSLVSGL